jgi:transposase
MEACGSAHHWARWLNDLGIEVRLLPAAYVRAYVKRNKTDAADACALLEAARCADIAPVRVKSVEQQALLLAPV